MNLMTTNNVKKQEKLILKLRRVINSKNKLTKIKKQRQVHKKSKKEMKKIRIY